MGRSLKVLYYNGRPSLVDINSSRTKYQTLRAYGGIYEALSAKLGFNEMYDWAPIEGHGHYHEDSDMDVFMKGNPEFKWLTANHEDTYDLAILPALNDVFHPDIWKESIREFVEDVLPKIKQYIYIDYDCELISEQMIDYAPDNSAVFLKWLTSLHDDHPARQKLTAIITHPSGTNRGYSLEVLPSITGKPVVEVPTLQFGHTPSLVYRKPFSEKKYDMTLMKYFKTWDNGIRFHEGGNYSRKFKLHLLENAGMLKRRVEKFSSDVWDIEKLQHFTIGATQSEAIDALSDTRILSSVTWLDDSTPATWATRKFIEAAAAGCLCTISDHLALFDELSFGLPEELVVNGGSRNYSELSLKGVQNYLNSVDDVTYALHANQLQCNVNRVLSASYWEHSFTSLKFMIEGAL